MSNEHDEFTELRAALAAGPTPGPRAIHRHAKTAVVNADGRVVASTGGASSTMPEDSGLSAMQAADALLIAACDPTTIARLLAAADRVKELEALLGEAVGALDLYHAYGWPDRLRVCDRIRAAIDRASGAST